MENNLRDVYRKDGDEWVKLPSLMDVKDGDVIRFVEDNHIIAEGCANGDPYRDKNGVAGILMNTRDVIV